MKTQLFIAVPILVMLGWSCTNELDNPIDEITAPAADELLTVVARVGDASDSKTAIQSDGSSIYWTEGDAINLFYGSGSAGQFVTSISQPSPVAEFTGTLSVATGTTEIGHEAKAFWAVYPYNAANTCDGTGVTLTIPGNQETIPGSFADNLNPTVATSPGLDLAFYNVGSWFIFSVTQEGVTSAVFRGNNNEDVAGTVRVSMDSSSRPVATVQSGIKSITITPASGGEFVPGELYYIVVLPQTLTNGYTLTLNKGNKSADCVVSNSAEFIRSQYRRKRNADEGLTFTTPLTALGATFEAVDLGLSVKWASFNLGATAPEEYGDYYAWGETEVKESYSYSNYKHGNGVNQWKCVKYCPQSQANLWVGPGEPDNLTGLMPEDDAAFQALGGKWRLPSDAEFTELINNCTGIWTDNYNGSGVAGMTFTSTIAGYTDKSVFLPASFVYNNSKYGIYWSSSLFYDDGNQGGSTLTFDMSTSNNSYRYRFLESSVRPVWGDIIVSDIVLNQVSASLETGHSLLLTATLSPCNATDKRVVWSSSDTSVATVNNDGLVSAIAPGNATITATTVDGSLTATCLLMVDPIYSVPAVPEAIDLGLSVKWASFNLGASAPEEYGDYFAWGETTPHYCCVNPFTWKEGKNGYSWSTYDWCTDATGDNLTKYSTCDSQDDYADYNYEDDAARANLKNNWRTPSGAEWTELHENCSWEYTWNYNGTGIRGFLVTGTNNNSIFLPTAGYYTDFEFYQTGGTACYWCSAISEPYEHYARISAQTYFFAGEGNHGGSNNRRCYGASIRPVTD